MQLEFHKAGLPGIFRVCSGYFRNLAAFFEPIEGHTVTNLIQILGRCCSVPARNINNNTERASKQLIIQTLL